MDYFVLISEGADHQDTVDDLAKQVNDYLKQGYKTIGGVSITNYAGVIFTAAQAMIKRDD